MDDILIISRDNETGEISLASDSGSTFQTIRDLKQAMIAEPALADLLRRAVHDLYGPLG